MMGWKVVSHFSDSNNMINIARIKYNNNIIQEVRSTFDWSIEPTTYITGKRTYKLQLMPRDKKLTVQSTFDRLRLQLA